MSIAQVLSAEVIFHCIECSHADPIWKGRGSNFIPCVFTNQVTSESGDISNQVLEGVAITPINPSNNCCPDKYLSSVLQVYVIEFEITVAD